MSCRHSINWIYSSAKFECAHIEFSFYSYHSLKGAKDSAIAFKNQTPLEIEVAKLLYGSKVNQQSTDESGNSVGLRYTHFRTKKMVPINLL